MSKLIQVPRDIEPSFNPRIFGMHPAPVVVGALALAMTIELAFRLATGWGLSVDLDHAYYAKVEQVRPNEARIVLDSILSPMFGDPRPLVLPVTAENVQEYGIVVPKGTPVYSDGNYNSDGNVSTQ